MAYKREAIKNDRYSIGCIGDFNSDNILNLEDKRIIKWLCEAWESCGMFPACVSNFSGNWPVSDIMIHNNILIITDTGDSSRGGEEERDRKPQQLRWSTEMEILATGDHTL